MRTLIALLAFVYHPARLEVLASCLRVSGIIAAIRLEADGDLHARRATALGGRGVRGRTWPAAH